MKLPDGVTVLERGWLSANQVVSASVQLKDLGQVNLALTNDLAVSRQESQELSNSLVAVNATLDGTKSTLATAQEQITNLNGRVSDLEDLSKQMPVESAAAENVLEVESAGWPSPRPGVVQE